MGSVYKTTKSRVLGTGREGRKIIGEEWRCIQWFGRESRGWSRTPIDESPMESFAEVLGNTFMVLIVDGGQSF
jgi:hypothetical protein